MRRFLNLLLVTVLLLFPSFSIAKGAHRAPAKPKSPTVAVRGSVSKKGKVTKPYVRTAPNVTQRDNWSSKPNVNPTNGKRGTKTPKK